MRIKPEPRITYLDASGNNLYTLNYHPGHGVQGDTDFVAASFGPDYTHAAELRFNHHHQVWEQKLVRYQEKKGALLQFMLGTLSSPSYEALMNIPAFPLAKAARDTRAIWKLFRQVH